MGLATAALRRVPLDEMTGNLDQSFDRRWNAIAGSASAANSQRRSRLRVLLV
jgi:hypothetical protein